MYPNPGEDEIGQPSACPPTDDDNKGNSGQVGNKSVSQSAEHREHLKTTRTKKSTTTMMMIIMMIGLGSECLCSYVRETGVHSFAYIKAIV